MVSLAGRRGLETLDVRFATTWADFAHPDHFYTYHKCYRQASGAIMTLSYLVVGGVAVLLFFYLLVALFFPERFQ